MTTNVECDIPPAKPRKINSIVYDIYTDIRRTKLVVAVIQKRENTSENIRIRSRTRRDLPLLPDEDRHIVCPRCRCDFGVSLDSVTVATYEFLRKIQGGVAPHNAYVDHLKREPCEISEDGRDVSVSKLLAAAQTPKRILARMRPIYNREVLSVFAVVDENLGGGTDVTVCIVHALRKLYTE